MKVYLNDKLICENTDSVIFNDIKKHVCSVESEYIDNKGKYFTVTVNNKDYKVRKCRLDYVDLITIPSSEIATVFLYT